MTMVNQMRTKLASVLLISILALGSFMTAVALMAGNASAASLSGTWESRVSGSGYIQTYMGPSGNTVTDHIDVKLILTQSGTSVTGTLRSDLTGGAKTFNVDGTFDGTTFLMTAHYGWDGVNMLNPVYTLTVSGDRMTGSGAYLNVGVTIHGTFDLTKSGGFGGLTVAGGMAPVVSGIAIAIAIVAIVIASTPVRSGFRPQVMSAPSPQYPYQPSVQTTTDNGLPIGPPEAGTPVGGAGLQYATPAPVGKPFPPRDHFTRVSQNPPRCPIHNDIALSPHFASAEDAGSWFCPRCNGYPWGKN
jgi:hypothetical protein